MINRHFVARTTARCAANLVDLNVKTACYYYQRLREIISQQLAKEDDLGYPFFAYGGGLIGIN